MRSGRSRRRTKNRRKADPKIGGGAAMLPGRRPTIFAAKRCEIGDCIGLQAVCATGAISSADIQDCHNLSLGAAREGARRGKHAGLGVVNHKRNRDLSHLLAFKEKINVTGNIVVEKVQRLRLAANFVVSRHRGEEAVRFRIEELSHRGK